MWSLDGKTLGDQRSKVWIVRFEQQLARFIGARHEGGAVVAVAEKEEALKQRERMEKMFETLGR